MAEQADATLQQRDMHTERSSEPMVSGSLALAFEAVLSDGFSDGEAVVYRSPLGDPQSRRIDLHNRLCERILKHRDDPRVMLVRYDDWFLQPDLLARVCAFAGIPSLGRLRPAPMPPAPLVLDAGERDRILADCTIAAELGFPLDGGRLAPPALLGARP